MSLYASVADLPLQIERYELRRLARTVSSGFERVSTVFALLGGGHEGLGEDVTYEAEAHDAQQAQGPVLPLAGGCTFASFSKRLGELDTFPGYTPQQDVYRRYRRWASSRPPWTSPCARPARRYTSCSAARWSPSRSSSPPGWASRRRLTP